MWAYLTSSISDPVAFVNKRSGTVSRVVVFTVMGVQGAYDRFNLMFAIQVMINGECDHIHVMCNVVISISVPQCRARGCGGEIAGDDRE